MSNNSISNHLTSNYLPGTIWSYEIEMFDIETKGVDRRAGNEMDALTSLELEAQRRRETVANDRDLALARATAPTERVDAATRRPSIEPASAMPARLGADSECQPSVLARQSAG
jgi:hypothetical protein